MAAMVANSYSAIFGANPTDGSSSMRSFGRATRALPTRSICISPLAATRAIGVMSQARRWQGHRHIMLAGHEPFHCGRVPLHLLI
jgi:hypothetical protein